MDPGLIDYIAIVAVVIAFTILLLITLDTAQKRRDLEQELTEEQNRRKELWDYVEDLREGSADLREKVVKGLDEKKKIVYELEELKTRFTDRGDTLKRRDELVRFQNETINLNSKKIEELKTEIRRAESDRDMWLSMCKAKDERIGQLRGNWDSGTNTIYALRGEVASLNEQIKRVKEDRTTYCTLLAASEAKVRELEKELADDRFLQKNKINELTDRVRQIGEERDGYIKSYSDLFAERMKHEDLIRQIHTLTQPPVIGGAEAFPVEEPKLSEEGGSCGRNMRPSSAQRSES